MFPVLAGSNPSGYNLTRSLRLRASASAYLNRTYSNTQTNAKIQTFSWWAKRGILGAVHDFFGAYDGTSATAFTVYFAANDTFNFDFGGASTNTLTTTQVFRDPSAWYHFVLAIDTTQATASNRYKLYVNGTQVTAFSTANYVAQNADSSFGKNNANNRIGTNWNNASQFLDGYMAEVNFIDGQALTPSSFGSTNTLTGVWQPAKYQGTYGTNGFYLPFTDNSGATATTIGKDFSGNGNNWTPNNISVTAGVAYDSMTDVPTLTSPTAANFATLNPLFTPTTAGSQNATITNGNLSFVGNASNDSVSRSTIGVTSGKYYCEVTVSNVAAIQDGIGIAYTQSDSTRNFGVIYRTNGDKCVNNSVSSYGSSYVANDVIGIALDATSNTVTFYKNNVSQGAISFTPTTAVYFSTYGVNSAGSFSGNINFGQRPFAYTPPSGYVALNTFNLSDSTIVKGNMVMDATLWTGNGATQTITNAAGFKPDLVWGKSRSTAIGNALYDSVRGVTKWLSSDSTSAEATYSGVTSFNSNGFSVGSSSDLNNNASTFVGWQWQAGQGTTSSNTNGTITSTVSVNASAGFSVVTYTGTGAAATVGHGLGVAPSMIVIKSRSSGSTGWVVYFKNVNASPQTSYLYLNSANSVGTGYAGYWNSTNPTSSVFSLGTDADVSASGGNMVAYCWTPIAGYSAFGSYTGNGSADGPFVYLGFRPKFVIVKNSSSSENWYILDSSRDTYNPEGNFLSANLSLGESSPVTFFDFLSNGIKIRNSGGYVNSSGATYIYIAFAENPFKNALAR